MLMFNEIRWGSRRRPAASRQVDCTGDAKASAKTYVRRKRHRLQVAMPAIATIAAIRFGFGLTGGQAPPTGAAALMADLAGTDQLVTRLPFAAFDDTVAGADRKSTRLNSSHLRLSRMPSSA